MSKITVNTSLRVEHIPDRRSTENAAGRKQRVGRERMREGKREGERERERVTMRENNKTKMFYERETTIGVSAENQLLPSYS